MAESAPAAAEPGSSRGARQRKTVEQFTIAVTEKAEFRVLPGTGTRLGDIEAVKAGLEKHKASEPLLQTLYQSAFGRRGAAAKVKAHLRDFSGFPYAADVREAEVAKRSTFLKKRGLPELKELCALCTLERSGTKDELIERLVSFLDKPEDTGRAPTAPRKRASTPAKKAKKPAAAKKKRAASPKADKAAAKRAKAASGKAASKPAGGKGGKDPAAAIKKPKGALELYVDARLPQLQEKNPAVDEAELRDHLRTKWKGLDEPKRAKYEAQAEELKAQYEKDVEAAREAAAKPAIVDDDEDEGGDEEDGGADDAADGDGAVDDEDDEDGGEDE